MRQPTDLLTAIPAHNEQHLIVTCLAAVRAAADDARLAFPGVRVHVGVAAHRCTDRTAELAAAATAGFDTVTVLRDSESETVGEVRHRLARAMLPWLGDASPRRAWLLSTDADSQVPRTWIRDMVAIARRERSHAVLGMTELIDWNATPEARAAYDEIITAGLTEDGHSHVYAANLAVRLDAYLDAGGFPSVQSGEDHGLVAALRAIGSRIATTRHPRVRTSGRMPGRAAHGLGAMLADIAQPALPAVAQGGVPA